MADPVKIADLYYEQELSTKQVAIALGISPTSVKRILQKSGYILRDPSQAMKLAYGKGRAKVILYERTPEIRQQIAKTLKQYYRLNHNPMLGKHPTPETIAKLRGRHYCDEALARMSMGQKSRTDRPMLGKHHSEESKRRMRDKQINLWATPAYQAKMKEKHKSMGQKISAIQKMNWKKAEYRAKVVPACLRNRRPTSLERIFNALIEKYALPYKYVGDGSFVIGGLNPDYININGEKVAIDIFGEYWHKDSGEYRRTEEGRKTILKEFGWYLIVIWESELKTLPENTILQKISCGEVNCLTK